MLPTDVLLTDVLPTDVLPTDVLLIDVLPGAAHRLRERRLCRLRRSADARHPVFRPLFSHSLVKG